MANTVIQLKYSSATAAPASLNVGEPAYSISSGNLFIGNTTSHAIRVGGKYFTDIVEAATNTNTNDTLVKRDGSGNFSAGTITAALSGNASTATKWQTARTIGVEGDANGTVSVDGSANANIPLTLGNSGVSAGTYGNTTIIPVITVDSKGRITSAANVTLVSAPQSLAVAGDTGTGSIGLAADTLTINGRDGITTQFVDANNSVLIDVDNTVLRTTGSQTITGDLSITGNLNIIGNTVTVNVSSLAIDDPLIQLAANNETSDAVDIGFYGHYSDDAGVTKRHVGLFRDASATDRRFILFENLVDANLDIGAAVTVNTGAASFVTANLQTNIVGGKVSGLSQAIAVADGGTGATSITNGQIVLGQGTGALATLPNVTAVSETVAAANTLNSFTTDVYGRVTAFTQQAIALAASQITSGTLPIARGGTNQTTFNTGERIVFNGTSLASQANATTTVTGGLSAANTITSLTVNSYGEVTAYTGAAIAIDAAQVTSGLFGVTRGGTGIDSYAVGDLIYASGATTLSKLADVATGNVLISGGVTTAPAWGKVGLTTHVTGTLGVGNGGTGNTSLQTNAVLIGQGTSAVTTVASSTEGHLLTISSGGVPQFEMLSGGTF
jgi:hypothetical protein